MKIARAENAGFLPVELAEPREQHSSDRHIDANAESVRAANDPKQSLLRQLLDQHTVFRKQSGVMQSDALSKPLFDVGAVGTRELEPFEFVRDRRLLLAGTNVEAREILGALCGVELREVNHVNRTATVVDEVLHRLGQRQFRVGIVERHRSIDRGHGDGRLAVQPGQFRFEERGVAERRRHQQEPGL